METVQHPMAAGGGEIILAAGEGRAPLTVFDGFLVDDIDDIATEACHTPLQPKMHGFFNRFDDCFIVIVEVRLFLSEKMKIIFPTQVIVLPAISTEEITPVGGLFALFPFPPDVIIGVGFYAAAALLEPFMLIAGVVDNKIHNNADVPLFCFCNEGIHILQRTIIGVDIAVIADIIAVILIG